MLSQFDYGNGTQPSRNQSKCLVLHDAVTELPATQVQTTGRVLFVQHCANYTGSTISGHLLVSGLRNSGWDVHVAFGFPGPYAAEYEAIGCETSVVKHNNWLRGGNVQQSFRRTLDEVRTANHFTRLLKEIQPDVVYVNSLVSLAAAIAAHRLGIPCVWHVRELFEDVGGEMHVPSLGGRWIVRKALARYADHLVVTSKAVAENIVGPGSLMPMTVIPNAVKNSFFDFDETQQKCRLRLGLPVHGPIIGVPGTLRPVKGHPFFLQAAGLLYNSHPKCVFAITGDGCLQYRDELLSQVREHGLEDNVFFLGTVNSMDSFFRACDSVCVPSVSESFGRTVVEAFAIGTPVVATAVGGIREIVDDGRTGLLVTYGDVDGLVAAMQKVLADTDLRTRLAVNAKCEADNQYRSERYHQRIHNVIRSVQQ